MNNLFLKISVFTIAAIFSLIGCVSSPEKESDVMDFAGHFHAIQIVSDSLVMEGIWFDHELFQDVPAGDTLTVPWDSSAAWFSTMQSGIGGQEPWYHKGNCWSNLTSYSAGYHCIPGTHRGENKYMPQAGK